MFVGNHPTKELGTRINKSQSIARDFLIQLTVFQEIRADLRGEPWTAVPTASTANAIKMLPDQFASTRRPPKLSGAAGGDNIQACPSRMVKPSVG